MHGRLRGQTAVLGGILLGAMQICGLVACAIAVLPLSSAFAADHRVTVPFTAVDGGDLLLRVRHLHCSMGAGLRTMDCEPIYRKSSVAVKSTSWVRQMRAKAA